MARQALQLPLWALLVSSSLLVVAAYMAYSFFLHPLAGLRGPLIARLGLPSWRTSK